MKFFSEVNAVSAKRSKDAVIIFDAYEKEMLLKALEYASEQNKKKKCFVTVIVTVTNAIVNAPLLISINDCITIAHAVDLFAATKTKRHSIKLLQKQIDTNWEIY
jgi:hypothetical protein